MAHSFDTGLSAPQRTLIRDGVITLLSPLKRSAGGYLADVAEFGWVVRTYTDVHGIERLMKTINRAPAIAVGLGSLFGAPSPRAMGAGSNSAMGELEILLYCATQHARDQVVGRHKADVVALADDIADPGLDIIMEHARELMLGMYPATATSVKQIKFQSEEELVSDEPITIWLQTYRVTTQIYAGGREWRTPEQLLTSINWRLTTDPDEPNRPAPAESSSTVDVDTTI